MIDWSIVASAHIFVDDKECIVCIPVTEKHGTFYTIHRQTINGITDANDVAFGVEEVTSLVVKTFS